MRRRDSRRRPRTLAGSDFHRSVFKSTNLAGGLKRLSRQARKFDCSRIGRGSGVGRVLGTSGRHSGQRSRHVVVKSRLVRRAGKGTGAAAAHLKYLKRDGTTREGECGSLYSAELDAADGKAFLERANEDRHQSALSSRLKMALNTRI